MAKTNTTEVDVVVNNSSLAGAPNPTVLAANAFDHASLGDCVMGEVHDYLEAIVALADARALPDDDLRRRLAIIQGLSGQARRYVEEMQGTFESIAAEARAELDAITLKVGNA